MALDIFDRSIISFFDNDMKKAHRNIESLRALETLCNEINSFVVRQETPDAIALGYIMESIRRAGEYSVYIPENVINYLVEEEQAVIVKKTRR